MDKDEQIRKLKEELTYIQKCLHEKNKKLDAMFFVWCDGGCVAGTGRWTDLEITEEILEIAERNTKRLRNWYINNQSRKKRFPNDPCLWKKQS